MESRFDEVPPVRPVAPYIGGKRNLAKRIVNAIEVIDHDIYAEPFVGMGGVFFRRDRRPKSEVINDWSKDVATLFRVIQRHYTAFVEMIRYQITTRSEFERLVNVDPDTMTDLERAARFLYLQRLSFGGKVRGQSFGVCPDRGGRFDVSKLVPMLEDVHDRLAGVVIECLPFQDFIRRYDRPSTLFYLDPPYWGCEDDYGRDVFSREDFESLAGVLQSIRGSFILSINDVPEIRELFAWANLQPVQTTYTIKGKGPARNAAELLISSEKLGRIG